MNIGIWGKGIVGSVTGKLFEHNLDTKVFYYDKYRDVGRAEDLVGQCDYIFLCLPTPMRVDGSISLDAIYESLKEITSLAKSRKLIIVRSTAVSGSTDELAKKHPQFDFAFCPEFLTEAHAFRDASLAEHVVIGANSDVVYGAVKSLFEMAYSNKIDYVRLTRKEAETLKYLANIFLASQVGIANELYEICKTINIDYSKLRSHILRDKRIGTHNQVPGPDGELGFGKKCFPKDMSAFIQMARATGYEPKQLDAIWKYNEKIRIKKDWFDIPGATERKDYAKEN